MPRIRRKAPVRRKRVSKRAGTVSRATKKYVKRMMPKVEMKQVWNHDNEIQLNTLSQGTVVSGPLVPQGVGASERVGNVIRAKGLHLKGTVYNNSGSESYARLIIVGHNGSLDPAQNLFRAGSTGLVTSTAGINGMDLMYYPVNKNEMRVYHDRVFKLGGSSTGTAASNTRMFSKFVKFNGRKVEYENTYQGQGYKNWAYSVVWIAADANDDTTTGTVVELSQLTRFYYTDA